MIAVQNTQTSQQASESKQRSIFDFCTPSPYPTVPLAVSLRVSLGCSINSGREGEGQQELASLPSALLMNRRSGTFSIRLCCRMPLLSGVSPASQSFTGCSSISVTPSSFLTLRHSSNLALGCFHWSPKSLG